MRWCQLLWPLGCSQNHVLALFCQNLRSGWRRQTRKRTAAQMKRVQRGAMRTRKRTVQRTALRREQVRIPISPDCSALCFYGRPV